MSFEDENVSNENLCYTELPINKPCPIERPEINIQLAPIVQPMTINATVNTVGAMGSPGMPTATMTPDGPIVVSGVDAKGKPIIINTEKKSKRIKNLIAGIVMLIASVIVLLPFIFSLDSIAGSMVNLYAFMPGLNLQGSLNAIQNTITFFSNTAAMASIWRSTMPSLLIAIGLLFVVFNIVKAFVGIFGGVKGRKYIVNSLLTIGFCATVVLLQLIGVDAIGLPKIDFVQEVVFGWKYSQTFVILAVALVNVVAACICAIFVPKKPMYDMGYRR
ncbi:MAG: hypothetical protein PHE93_02665 [Clostridia bacterium]|nr:hypothetical protein [Clostridia bacterium]